MKTSHHLPSLIITGGSGFIGKHLLDEFKEEFRIFAIARRSQNECNAPKHPNIAWLRADISNLNSISKAFREIVTAGGADYLIHLAAYYDFVNDYHPEYQKTNIEGTKNVLNLAKDLNLKLFLFASSVAACSFPKLERFIDEKSPADGAHVYAKSKRTGEELVREFSKRTPSIIFRLGAVYTDWCEYPPLFTFLETWLGKSWRARVLAGKGNSAIPYIHIRDVVQFIRQLLRKHGELQSGGILLASTNDSTSHLELFKLATKYFYGKERMPILMPKFLCGLGIYVINFFKTLLDKEIFEKPWMIKYIDKKLNVRNNATTKILRWEPSARLSIVRRFPFLIERMKCESLNWQMRNIMVLRKTVSRTDFNIFSLLVDEEDNVVKKILANILTSSEFSHFAHLENLDRSELKWFVKLIYRLILTSIDSNNKLLIQNYFEISGISRFRSGYEPGEIIFILKSIDKTIITHLQSILSLSKYKNEFYFYITLPIEFGIDEVEQQFASFSSEPLVEEPVEEKIESDEQMNAKKLLEETIWNCLVNRK